MEEIRAIAEILATLGGEAKVAFIVWVLAKYIMCQICVTTVFATFFYLVYKLLYPIVYYNKFIQDIKAVMGFTGALHVARKSEIIRVLARRKED